MAKRNIVTYGSEILKTKSEPVTVFDDELQTLIADMFDTMKAANGVGFAAVQIGVLKRVITIEIPEDTDDENGKSRKYVLVNPEIISESLKKQKDSEGCLSVPGLNCDVSRAYKVMVKALNEKGEEYTLTGKGLLARAIQHENDHLNGVLFVDRISAAQKKIIEDELKFIDTEYKNHLRLVK